MDKKLTPMQMVAREMDGHSGLNLEQINASMKRALNQLRKHAADEITLDETSDRALAAAQEYQVISEMINTFGSQLIAFEELDIADVDRIKN